jgi:RHS repeat-associated protein
MIGNRTYREESGPMIPFNHDSYSYDAIDQITQVKYGFDGSANTSQREVDYSYDAIGNRLSMIEDADGSGPSAPVTTPYTANSLNQYTAIDGLTTPQYDTNGNLTLLQTELSDPAWTYQYDAQNRLIGGSNGVTSFTFAYDPRNRCIARTINGVTTLNIYEGWNLIEEYSTSGVLSVKQVQGASIDEILCSIGASGAVYHQHDGNGSVTGLTDSTGTLVERYTYDVYGMPTILDPSCTPLVISAYGNRFLYTGREWFSQLRLNDNRNRYYQPKIGRWLSRDPIQEQGGMSLYNYVLNTPVNFVDTGGLSSGGLSFIKLTFGADTTAKCDVEKAAKRFIRSLGDALRKCCKNYGEACDVLVQFSISTVRPAPPSYGPRQGGKVNDYPYNQAQVTGALGGGSGRVNIVFTDEIPGPVAGWGGPGVGVLLECGGNGYNLPHELGHVVGLSHVKPNNSSVRNNLMDEHGGTNPDPCWCKKIQQLAK